MTSLPANRLIQARALLEDIRAYIKQESDQREPFSSTTDYRMVDVFRGLTLATHGLDALIEDKHYTEYQQMLEAVKNWPGMADEPLESG
jgi:hypothetical protein